MIRFEGAAHNAAMFLQKEQLSDPVQWAKFVDVYRSQPDDANQGWRGEYWGKMMRGAALVYEYTRDAALYDILTDSVKDMLTVAEADGRVSSYRREAEFDSWDLWSRKYVILACEYYLDICKDEAFKAEILSFLCRSVDYIIAHIGPDKKKITSASRSWRGVNSSSILEPIVRLYRLTGKVTYLDFARYIVEEGGADGINIFKMAYENKIYPYQYGVSKAYEMTSCFEGLLEYYLVTGIEKHKIAVENYAKAVLDSEMSIIGSCGITHELFDHTRTRQTVRQEDVMQETCVTVTLMKFCSRMLELTGDSLYADAMEQSFYNAYLGSININHLDCGYVMDRYADQGIVHTYMPFDSYSPLTPGLRGRRVGGFQLLPDRSYYGCCACIGSAGVGVFLKKAITVDANGITVNFFETGKAELSYNGVPVTITMETAYPVDGHVKLCVQTAAPVTFALRVRNPGWAVMPKGYTVYTKEWTDDTLELYFDMPIRFHYPEHWEEDVVYTDTSSNGGGYHSALPKTVHHKAEEDNYVAVTRGPLTLAADSRMGKDADSVYSLTYETELCEPQIVDGVPCMLKLKVKDTDGSDVYLVDYASAGQDWETVIAAWLPTKA